MKDLISIAVGIIGVIFVILFFAFFLFPIVGEVLNQNVLAFQILLITCVITIIVSGILAILKRH
ncbi:hypothetical protein DSECCO2_646630 [anaerobic digester metagenome]